MANTSTVKGPATILALATAVPSNVIIQKTYPDVYFGIADPDNRHMGLKKKFQRICDSSAIKKRHVHLTNEMLEENPELHSFDKPSLNTRQKICIEQVPLLGKEASVKAIQNWGQPLSKITHLVFGAVGGVDSPGADYRLMKLLGLEQTVNRIMIYQQGCGVGGTVLRIAKDLAENNKDSRVLVVCSEITASFFRGPHRDYLDGLVGAAIFGDGASAAIVGSHPVHGVEKPMYEVCFASQTTIPNCDDKLTCHIREVGVIYDLKKEIPALVSSNIEVALKSLVNLTECKSYNEFFWAVHPGGRKILDEMEEKLGLNKEKLNATRRILSEYGNMSSCSVFFALEEVWKASTQGKYTTSGEGLKWGIMLGFGPGITIEALLLKSVELKQEV